MNNDYEAAAFKEYVMKLIWQGNRQRTLLQAYNDTDLSGNTWETLEFIAKELEEKETAAT